MNNYGFTFIELIISIAILSIIFVLIGTVLDLGFEATENGEQTLNTLQRGQYLINKITSEVREGSGILDINKIKDINKSKYRDNFGFVILNQEKEKFILYYRENRYNRIKRATAENIKGKSIKASNFLGHNIIGNYVEKINNNGLNKENKIINLRISIKNKRSIINFNKDISVQCPIK